MEASFLTHFSLDIKSDTMRKSTQSKCSHGLIYMSRHRHYSLKIMKMRYPFKVTKLCIVARQRHQFHCGSEVFSENLTKKKKKRKEKIKCAYTCESTRFQWVEGAVRTGEMRGWGRAWGRWEKTGGGGGNVMYLLATATLRNCTMHLTQYQNELYEHICSHSSE